MISEERGSTVTNILRGIVILIIFFVLLFSNFWYLLADEVGFGHPIVTIYSFWNFVGTIILGALLGRSWLGAILVVSFPVVAGIFIEFNILFDPDSRHKFLYYLFYLIILPLGVCFSGSFIGFIIYKIYRKKFNA